MEFVGYEKKVGSSAPRLYLFPWVSQVLGFSMCFSLFVFILRVAMFLLFSFQKNGKDKIVSFRSSKREICIVTLDWKFPCSLKFCFIKIAFALWLMKLCFC